MLVSQLYVPTALRASALTGETTATIATVEVATNQDGSPKALVLHFAGLPGGLTLNRRSALALATAFGDDSDAWVNCTVTLAPKTVRAFGADRQTITVAPGAPAAARPARRRNGKRAAAAEEPAAEVVEPTI